jgi:hypothetical protein
MTRWRCWAQPHASVEFDPIFRRCRTLTLPNPGLTGSPMQRCRPMTVALLPLVSLGLGYQR